MLIKAIWMSDPHFTHSGTVVGHDPRVRLHAAIQQLNLHHADSAFCIISGDMVNRGSQQDYATLRQLLDTLSIPYLPMVGNHDDRLLFRDNLPLPETCVDDFVQYTVPTSAGLFAFLDTLKLGDDAGEFCAKRMQWLDSTLSAADDTPVYLFMHHPPMVLGLPAQDSEKLQEGDEFLELISAYSNVKYLFIGHVHRPISGAVRGIPFSTMRSVLVQAPAPQPQWDWDTFKPAQEAPNFGVLTISQKSINLQYTQFCSYEHGVSI